MRRVGTGLCLLLLAGVTAAGAQPVSRDEALLAPIHLDQPRGELGRTVRGQIVCLERWRAGTGDRRAPNRVTFEEVGRDRWRVSVTLREPTLLHFTVTRTGGQAVAVLTRLEHRLGGAYQQINGAVAQRAALDAMCQPAL
jgi:hypothetical protein